MNTTSNTIVSNLKLLSDSDKQTFDYNRRHFFLNILDHLYQTVSLDQKMEMMYYFSTIEKCLVFSRDKSFSIVTEMLKKLHEFKLDLPPIPYSGMMTSYYPMVAYYQYAQKQYEEAKSLLSQSFEHIHRVYQSGEKSALLDLVEQKLNLIRINLDSKPADDSLNEINDLLSFLYHSKANDGYYGNINEVFTQGDEDKTALFKHYFDAIFVKLNHQISLTDKTNNDRLRIVFQDLALESESSPIQSHPEYMHAFQAADAYLNDDYNGFIRNLDKTIGSFQKLPEFLQIMLLEWFSQIEENNTELDQIRTHYFETFLKKYDSYKNLNTRERYKANNNPLYFVKD